MLARVKHRGDGVQGEVEVAHGVQVSLCRPHRLWRVITPSG